MPGKNLLNSEIYFATDVTMIGHDRLRVTFYLNPLQKINDRMVYNTLCCYNNFNRVPVSHVDNKVVYNDFIGSIVI